MKITSIPQLYRNLNRWREILAVLRRYGMANWLSQFRLPFRDALKDRGGVPLSQYTREERVRMVLTELGPTFIKLGQILAARPDLVGPKLAEELKKLRADVSPDTIQQVRKTLAQELGADFEKHFQSIDPHPLATASIGQVHRAVLCDGTPVVIKVQRADIERTMRQDVEVLSGLAQLAERVETLAAWGPAGMASQLAPMMLRELDFSRERQNLDFFAHAFERRKLDVVIPRPVNQLCSRRVLVMNELRGTPLSEFLRIEQQQQIAAVNNGQPVLDHVAKSRTEMKQRLSETIANAYLTMLFDEALFHADPHTANLLVMDDGQLGILDFGMIGRIDDNLRETIEEMLIAISKGDQNRMTRLIRRIGDAPPILDESALAIDTADFIGTFARQSLGDFDLTGALNELSDILHRHAIKLPNQSALLLKMLISLEGTLRELGAGFDSLDVVQKFMRRSMVRRLSPARRVKQARRIYLEAENFMELAPDELITLLKQARRGELRMNLEHRRLSPSINRMVLGWMASAVFLGSSLMLAMKVPPLLFHQQAFLGTTDLSLLGVIGIVASVVVMLRLLFAINRSGHLTRENDD
jgi:ubiquinone biosynthesis protein